MGTTLLTLLNCVFQGSKCEVQVKNGGIYEGVFKTYSPKVILTKYQFFLQLPESVLSLVELTVELAVELMR